MFLMCILIGYIKKKYTRYYKLIKMKIYIHTWKYNYNTRYKKKKINIIKANCYKSFGLRSSFNSNLIISIILKKTLEKLI